MTVSRERNQRRLPFTLSIIAACMSNAPAYAGATGDIFTCHFGQYGKVIIDTREPGSSITINGHRYPSQSGSYFYQSDDGKIGVMFGPNMKWWSYNGIHDHHCKRQPNNELRQHN